MAPMFDNRRILFARKRFRPGAFRDGWTARRRRASRNPAAPRNAVSPWEAGAPRSAASRWEAAANPWLGAIARRSRTGSSKSISLQRRVRSLSRIRFRRSRTPAVGAGVRSSLDDRVRRDAQNVSTSRQPPGNISVGPYSSTAVLLMWSATTHTGPNKVGPATGSRCGRSLNSRSSSSKAEHGSLLVPGKRQT